MRKTNNLPGRKPEDRADQAGNPARQITGTPTEEVVPKRDCEAGDGDWSEQAVVPIAKISHRPLEVEVSLNEITHYQPTARQKIKKLVAGITEQVVQELGSCDLGTPLLIIRVSGLAGLDCQVNHSMSWAAQVTSNFSRSFPSELAEALESNGIRTSRDYGCGNDWQRPKRGDNFMLRFSFSHDLTSYGPDLGENTHSYQKSILEIVAVRVEPPRQTSWLARLIYWIRDQLP